MSDKMFTTGRAKAIEQLAKELETGYGAPYVIPTSESGVELDTLIGALAATAVIDPAASGSMIALLKGIIKQLQGDGAAGKSAPVTLSGSIPQGTNEIGRVQLSGSRLEEQFTQASAAANVLTFTENISVIEIYHEEETWQEFTVNGLTLTIPSGGYRTPVGGTPSDEVTIPAGVNCLVGRLV